MMLLRNDVLWEMSILNTFCSKKFPAIFIQEIEIKERNKVRHVLFIYLFIYNFQVPLGLL